MHETSADVRRRTAARRFMAGRGESVTFDEVAEHLKSLGFHYSTYQFKLQRAKLWGVGANMGMPPATRPERRVPRPDAAAVVPGVTLLPPDAPELAAVPARKAAMAERADWDRLAEFARFAAAVNTVGGVERARAYLDVIERMQRAT